MNLHEYTTQLALVHAYCTQSHTYILSPVEWNLCYYFLKLLYSSHGNWCKCLLLCHFTQVTASPDPRVHLLLLSPCPSADTYKHRHKQLSQPSFFIFFYFPLVLASTFFCLPSLVTFYVAFSLRYSFFVSVLPSFLHSFFGDCVLTSTINDDNGYGFGNGYDDDNQITHTSHWHNHYDHIKYYFDTTTINSYGTSVKPSKFVTLRPSNGSYDLIHFNWPIILCTSLVTNSTSLTQLNLTFNVFTSYHPSCDLLFQLASTWIPTIHSWWNACLYFKKLILFYHTHTHKHTHASIDRRLGNFTRGTHSLFFALIPNAISTLNR